MTREEHNEKRRRHKLHAEVLFGQLMAPGYQALPADLRADLRRQFVSEIIDASQHAALAALLAEVET